MKVFVNDGLWHRHVLPDTGTVTLVKSIKAA